MNNETSKPIKILCVASFVVVAITSIPLFVSYLKGIPPKYPLIVNLHVWAGIVFIVFALIKMTQKNKL